VGSGSDGNEPEDERNDAMSTGTNRGSEEQSEERFCGDAPCWCDACAHGGGRERCSLDREPPLSPVLGVSSR